MKMINFERKFKHEIIIFRHLSTAPWRGEGGNRLG